MEQVYFKIRIYWYSNVSLFHYLMVSFILMAFSLDAQELMVVTKKSYVGSPDREVFQVKKDQPDTKQGFYKRFIRKTLVESGFYRDNLRDSIWQIFDQYGQKIGSGYYERNEKVGIWTYYSKHGVRLQEYDYNLDTLLYFNVEEERKDFYAPASFPDTFPERMPCFIGGMHHMYTLLENNLVFPESERKKHRESKVIIQFTADAQGYTSDVSCVNEVSKSFANEWVRVFSSFGKSWIPGYTNGKFVPVTFTFPIVFQLN